MTAKATLKKMIEMEPASVNGNTPLAAQPDYKLIDSSPRVRRRCLKIVQ